MKRGVYSTYSDDSEARGKVKKRNKMGVPTRPTRVERPRWEYK